MSPLTRQASIAHTVERGAQIRRPEKQAKSADQLVKEGAVRGHDPGVSMFL